jgi:hypothetical protein
MVTKSPAVTGLVHVVPQTPPWHAVFVPQAVTAVPHCPHALHVTYPPAFWHCVVSAVHTGLGGHWQLPPVATLSQPWLGSVQPAHAAPPFPHDVVD